MLDLNQGLAGYLVFLGGRRRIGDVHRVGPSRRSLWSIARNPSAMADNAHGS
jgi:hypothetical protein